MADFDLCVNTFDVHICEDGSASPESLRYGSVMTEQLLDAAANAGITVMDRDRTEGLDRIGLALADPIRRSVLVRLLDGSQYPSDLADAIGTSRSNLSNHLACLRGCGLVSVKRIGRRFNYTLVSAELTDALRSLLAVADTLSPCDDHMSPPNERDDS